MVYAGCRGVLVARAMVIASSAVGVWVSGFSLSSFQRAGEIPGSRGVSAGGLGAGTGGVGAGKGAGATGGVAGGAGAGGFTFRSTSWIHHSGQYPAGIKGCARLKKSP